MLCPSNPFAGMLAASAMRPRYLAVPSGFPSGAASRSSLSVRFCRRAGRAVGEEKEALKMPRSDANWFAQELRQFGLRGGADFQRRNQEKLKADHALCQDTVSEWLRRLA